MRREPGLRPRCCVAWPGIGATVDLGTGKRFDVHQAYADLAEELGKVLEVGGGLQAARQGAGELPEALRGVLLRKRNLTGFFPDACDPCALQLADVFVLVGALGCCREPGGHLVIQVHDEDAGGPPFTVDGGPGEKLSKMVEAVYTKLKLELIRFLAVAQTLTV